MGMMKGAALAFCGAVSSVGLSAGMFDLADDGKPQAKIVIAEKAGKVERFAAEELKSHLDGITGGAFEIIECSNDRLVELKGKGLKPIFVGESAGTTAKRADFKPQEYVVDVRDDAIELVGSDRTYPGTGMPGLYDRQGTLYAVYAFLERDCGVRWLNPTDYGTFLPKNPNLSVSVATRRGRPAFSFRGGAGLDNRVPILWKDGTDGAKRYNDFAFASVKAANAPMRERQKLFLLRHRAGGVHAQCNHSFYGWYERFLDKTHKNFESYHPEYFAKGQPGQPAQLCYSNPGVIAQAIKDARDYFDHGGYPKAYRGTQKGFHWGENNFALEPMDGGGFCRCPDCIRDYEPQREGEGSADSTYWFKFVNAVAKEVKKTHPDKTISTLAYATHEGLPTNVRLEDNVVVYFCVSANREPTSQLLRDQFERMTAWRKAYPDMKIAMWLYNCFPKFNGDRANFNVFPGFFAHAADREFKFFRDIGATAGIFFDGFNGDVDSYVHLKLMQDPSRTADDILDEFFAPLGETGRHLRRFYEIIEGRYCNPDNWPKGAGHETAKIAWEMLGTAETMSALEEELKAADAAATTPFEKGFAKVVRLGVWDYMVPGRESYVKRSSMPMPTWTAKRVPSAGGAPDKVDWTGVETIRPVYYTRGSDEKNPWRCDMRIGHDGEYLYVELVEYVDTSKLINAPRVQPTDTWEFLFANDRALPYRYYITAPDGRMECLSSGEINWRTNVPAAESGDITFKARAANDYKSEKDRWTARYSFPLDWAASKPVKPGDTLYANIIRVPNTSICGVSLCGAHQFGVYSFVSYTTVHTTDRTATIILEK